MVIFVRHANNGAHGQGCREQILREVDSIGIYQTRRNDVVLEGAAHKPASRGGSCKGIAQLVYYLPSGASVETDAGSIEAEPAEGRKISTQLSGRRHPTKNSLGNRLE